MPGSDMPSTDGTPLLDSGPSLIGAMAIAIAILVLAGGFFFLFEKAFKAARKSRLQKEIDDAEKPGAAKHKRLRPGKISKYRRMLELIENPGNFFTVVRFWRYTLRTTAAVLTGYSMGHLTHNAVVLVAVSTAALVLGFLLLDSLVLRIARRSPESIAAFLFPFFPICALPLKPFFLLSQTAGERLRQIFPSKEGRQGKPESVFSPQAGRQGITEDELHYALMEGEKSGIVESKERTMVEGVFYLGDRPLGTFMTHRSELQWLDINAPAQDIRARVLEHRAQRCFPVADGTLDTIIGAAYVEDVILDLAGETPAGLRAIMKKALFAPETMPALKAFESFRRGKADFLFAMDEYGGFAGMVCVQDLMEEIVGELAAPAGEEEEAVQQKDGSWLADGALNIDDAAELFSLPSLAASGDYHTLAGFVLSLAEELPRAGDSFMYQGYRFTVLDMDGNRIDKVGVKKEADPE